MTKENLTNEGADILVAAIVNRAVEDYFSARFILDTQALHKTEKYKLARNHKLFFDAYKFFKSDWYHTLVPQISSKVVLDAINERYYNEYFFEQLDRYAKSLDISPAKIKRFRTGFRNHFYYYRTPVEERIAYYDELI